MGVDEVNAKNPDLFKLEYLGIWNSRRNGKTLAKEQIKDIFGLKEEQMNKIDKIEPNEVRNVVVKGYIEGVSGSYNYYEIGASQKLRIEGHELSWSYDATVVPAIKKVIFNDPATIVLWEDGTKTVVRKQSEDKKKKFDKEKGLAMAIAKKTLGNQGNYFDTIKKWVRD